MAKPMYRLSVVPALHPQNDRAVADGLGESPGVYARQHLRAEHRELPGLHPCSLTDDPSRGCAPPIARVDHSAQRLGALCIRAEQSVDLIEEQRRLVLPNLAKQGGLCRAGRVPGSPHEESRSEEHTSELQSQFHLVCRLLLE